ncbi:MAG: hybrid sensor histidine kinase/response regulator, partial [Myxococcaceae bacterium]|nr:hybrid sensor histidine kinase/response regulator [Myxococcaceae bacterium]
GYTDYILERKLGPVSPKQEKGLVVVQRNLDRLSRSISALLDFSRMDAGRLPLNIAPFVLPALLDGIATGLRSEMERKRLDFAVLADADLPPVIGDREKLSAVFENLIVNAIKFTPAGGRITVSATRLAGAERPSVELRVADTGIGIPSDQLERVFQRFHQVDSSTTRRFGGVGLGLAIVKSILDAHASPISVESRLEVGTVFRFTLPVLERQEPPTPGSERADGARPPAGAQVGREAREPTVLVLHGAHETVERIRDTLMAEGFRPVVVGDTGQALLALARERPAAVIVDGAPGWEAAESIREALARGGGQVPMLSLAADGVTADLHELLATLRREMEHPPTAGAATTAARTRT